MKTLKRLDPTWWRKAPGGYDQQDGRARLVRLKQRTKVTGWGLYVDGAYCGSWPTLAQSKRRATEMKEVATTTPCRACEGDGIIAADADTLPHERVTRSSKRCPYCNGKGTGTKKLELEPTSTKPAPSAGKCQPLGDPAASCTGTYPDVDGTYADCGDYDCPRHVPAVSSAKPESAS